MDALDRVLAEIDRAVDEIVHFTVDLVRIPTVNPPGDECDACARSLRGHLKRSGHLVEFIVAEGRSEHSRRHPRVNVVGTRHGSATKVIALATLDLMGGGG